MGGIYITVIVNPNPEPRNFFLLLIILSIKKADLFLFFYKIADNLAPCCSSLGGN